MSDRNNTKIETATEEVDIPLAISGTPPEIEAITKDEAPLFKAPESSIILEKKDERILIISQARLTGEPSGWRFKYDSDDFSDFQADIVDPSFLERIKDRKYVLKNGDMVRFLLKTQQSRQRRNLKTEYTILRVLEFLPFDENDITSL